MIASACMSGVRVGTGPCEAVGSGSAVGLDAAAGGVDGVDWWDACVMGVASPAWCAAVEKGADAGAEGTPADGCCPPSAEVFVWAISRSVARRTVTGHHRRKRDCQLGGAGYLRLLPCLLESPPRPVWAKRANSGNRLGCEIPTGEPKAADTDDEDVSGLADCGASSAATGLTKEGASPPDSASLSDSADPASPGNSRPPGMSDSSFESVARGGIPFVSAGAAGGSPGSFTSCLLTVTAMSSGIISEPDSLDVGSCDTGSCAAATDSAGSTLLLASPGKSGTVRFPTDTLSHSTSVLPGTRRCLQASLVRGCRCR